MKMCLGPCVLDVDRDSYVELVKRAILVLQEKNKDVLNSIKKEMAKAAAEESLS